MLSNGSQQKRASKYPIIKSFQVLLRNAGETHLQVSNQNITHQAKEEHLPPFDTFLAHCLEGFLSWEKLYFFLRRSNLLHPGNYYIIEKRSADACWCS